ncbi:unnamed protein product [Amoebophrya sp. A25]|nr:unnamed protein product [Amoebophrya sp. A25]|eukprot:GSA25T00014752001.1
MKTTKKMSKVSRMMANKMSAAKMNTMESERGPKPPPVYKPMTQAIPAGKIVSLRMPAAAKESGRGNHMLSWLAALAEARKALGITGYVRIGGKTPQGKRILQKIQEIMAEKEGRPASAIVDEVESENTNIKKETAKKTSTDMKTLGDEDDSGEDEPAFSESMISEGERQRSILDPVFKVLPSARPGPPVVSVEAPLSPARPDFDEVRAQARKA